MKNQVDYQAGDGETQQGRRRGASQQLPAVRPDVLIFDLLDGEHYQTSGGGAGGTNIILDKEFHGLGPQLAGMTIHGFLEEVTSNFSLSVRGQYSFNGRLWQDFTSPFLTMTGAGGSPVQAISDEYTDTSEFGLRLRFKINISDNNTIQSAVVSLKVAMRFHS